MWNLVAFVGLSVFLIGVVNVLKPIQVLRIPTRKHASGITMVGLIVLGVMGFTRLGTDFFPDVICRYRSTAC